MVMTVCLRYVYDIFFPFYFTIAMIDTVINTSIIIVIGPNRNRSHDEYG